MSSSVPAVTDATFQSEVLDADRPVLVDFWAEWCGPCKMIAPVVDQLSEELNGRVKFLKMDIDANRDMQARLGIMSIPTVIIFKGGQAVDRTIGYKNGLKADLRERLEALL